MNKVVSSDCGRIEFKAIELDIHDRAETPFGLVWVSFQRKDEWRIFNHYKHINSEVYKNYDDAVVALNDWFQHEVNELSYWLVD